MQPVTKKPADPAAAIQLPPLASKLNAMLDGGQFAAAEIGRMLRHDAPLCAHLLRMANSPMYADDMPVETIEQMVNYIGVIQLRELLLLLGLIARIRPLLRSDEHARQRWRQHVYTGLLAYHLARQSRQVHSHTVYTACLLHGMVELLARGTDSNLSFGQIIGQWGLPPILAECAKGCEQPPGQPAFPEAVTHVHIACRLAQLPENISASSQVLAGIKDAHWPAVFMDDNRLNGCMEQAREMLGSTLALLANE